MLNEDAKDEDGDSKKPDVKKKRRAPNAASALLNVSAHSFESLFY